MARTDDHVAPWVARSRFAAALSQLYAREVPAYAALVRTCHEINVERATDEVGSVDRLARVTAERHGAIRVGGPGELRDVARLFAQLGMSPVGFYDLRDAAEKAVPVISTAFRPLDPVELDRNAFRVFTSMLVTDDTRFFDARTAARVERHVADRRLFSPRLEELLDRAEAGGGIARTDLDEFVDEAVSAFELSTEPLDEDWHATLHAISPVAADIAAGPGTHINHLTPRVLDIDELYARMEAQGIAMIDRIQGPPRWDGPLVLLRQTSFRALDERRGMRRADGTEVTRDVRVRFGEVEARGVALTPRGRRRYDEVIDAGLEALRAGEIDDYQRAVAPGFAERFPSELTDLVVAGLAYGRFEAQPVFGATVPPAPALRDLLDAGLLALEPITYEDFLPRSAAGIFQSNLATAGRRDDDRPGSEHDVATLASAIGGPIHDPYELYAEQQRRSLRDALDVLGLVDLPVDALLEVERAS